MTKDKQESPESDPNQGLDQENTGADTESTAEVTENKEPDFEAKYLDINDRFVRLYAEFDNFRKRTAKERLDLVNSASASLIKDLIPTLDDMDRATLNNQNIEDAVVLKEGFKLISDKFRNALEAKGLKAMNALNEPFDPELHEAIAQVPVTDEAQKKKVIDEVEKGYFLNDKVIRFAKVVVGE